MCLRCAIWHVLWALDMFHTCELITKIIKMMNEYNTHKSFLASFPFLLLPRQLLICLPLLPPSLQFSLHFLEIYTTNIQYIPLFAWLLLFIAIIWESRMLLHISIVIFCLSTVWINHSLFLHSFIDRHLGCSLFCVDVCFHFSWGKY